MGARVQQAGHHHQPGRALGDDARAGSQGSVARARKAAGDAGGRLKFWASEAGGLALTYLGVAALSSVLLTTNDAPTDRANRRGKTKVWDQGYRHTKPARERVAAAAH